MNNLKVSFYKNVLAKKSTPVNLIELLEEFGCGEYSQEIEGLRKLRNENVSLYKKEKTKLPLFTPSGYYKGARKGSPDQYSQLVVLDIDDLNELLEKVKSKLKTDEHVLSVTLSPSDNGLKVFVKVDSTLEYHKIAFQQLKEYFEKLTGVEIDKSGSDVSRGCFITYDQNIYINPDSKVFNIDPTAQKKEGEKISSSVSKTVNNDSKTINEIIEFCIDGLICLTQSNEEWYKILYALLNSKISHQEAKESFLVLCRLGDNHDEEKSLELFEHGLKNNDKKIGLGTLIHYAKEHGFKTYSEEETEEFWKIDKEGKLKISQLAFQEFLQDNGFRMYSESGAPKYLSINDGIIDIIEPHIVKQFVKNYILSLPKEISKNHTKKDLLEVVLKSKNIFFGSGSLEFIDEMNQKIHTDARDEVFLYFKNGVAKITATTKELIPYSDLDGVIWKKQQLNRTIELHDTPVYSDFRDFIIKITAEEANRTKSLCSSIGYFLSRHKDEAKTKAVVFMDEVISEDQQADGGKGKSLIAKAIGKMRNLCVIDGKNFSFGRFCFQSINVDTNVVLLDDVEKGFDLEKLYSIITESMNIERKGEHQFTIPFDRSPKFLLSTNYIVRGSGGDSEKRRKFEIEFADYFGADHTPIKEYGGKRFFEDWNEEDWNAFDNFMIECIQLFLAEGLAEYTHVNLERRMVISDTNLAVVEFMESYTFSKKEEYRLDELKSDFIARYSEYGQLGQTRFNRMIRFFIKYKGWKTYQQINGGVKDYFHDRNGKQFMKLV